MKGQLALTQPTRRVNTRSLTERQRSAWRWARTLEQPFTAESFSKTHCYKDPYHALRRLIDRGLVMRVTRGYYKGVTPGERKR